MMVELKMQVLLVAMPLKITENPPILVELTFSRSGQFPYLASF